MDVQAVKKKFSEKICDIEATIEAFRRHSENILDPGNRRKIQPVGECLDKVKKIGKAVSRDQMRVVFFGKTSNGKSTVINALLGGDVCPAGYGTTTGCFCCIEKVPEGKAKAYRPSTIVPAQAPNGPRNNIPQRHGVGEDEEAEDDAKGEWIPLEDGALKDIISKFGEHTLTSKYVVHVRWPEEQCPLLVDDVAIIDTPGIDANAMDDGNIGVMCTDADVFVYVCDGKGTIEQREMDFLKRVQQCVSNLTENNLFIAVNWWDLVEKKGEAFQVKKQLVDRVTKFLKKEFGFHEESVQRRVFCISGEEALATPKPGSTDITAGQKLRQKAFDKFKEALLHCLTEDGLKTRFGRHCGSLRESVGTLCKCVSEVIGVIDRRQASVELKIENLDECCVNLDQGVEDLESQRCSRHEDTVIVAIVGIVVAKVNEARQRVPVVVRNCANVYQFHGVEEFKKQALADVQLSYDAINADLERELETIYLVGEKELTRVYRNCFQEYSSLQGQQAEPRPGVEPEPVPLNQIGVENNDLPWLKAENVAIKPRRMCDCDVVSTWVFACLIGVIAIYMKGLNAVWTIILLAGAAWFANKIWPQLFSDSMKEEVKEQVIARLCSQLDGKAVMMKQNFVACLENRLKEQSAACQVTLKGWQEVLNDESRNFQDELEKTKEDIGKLKEFRTEFISEQNWLNTFGDELHKVELQQDPLIGVEKNELPWLKTGTVSVSSWWSIVKQVLPRTKDDVVAGLVGGVSVGVATVSMSLPFFSLGAALGYFGYKAYRCLLTDDMKEAVKDQIIARLCGQLDARADAMKQEFVAHLTSQLKEQSFAYQNTLEGRSVEIELDLVILRDERKKIEANVLKLYEFRDQFADEQIWLCKFRNKGLHVRGVARGCDQ